MSFILKRTNIFVGMTTIFATVLGIYFSGQSVEAIEEPDAKLRQTLSQENLAASEEVAQKIIEGRKLELAYTGNHIKVGRNLIAETNERKAAAKKAAAKKAAEAKAKAKAAAAKKAAAQKAAAQRAAAQKAAAQRAAAQRAQAAQASQPSYSAPSGNTAGGRNIGQFRATFYDPAVLGSSMGYGGIAANLSVLPRGTRVKIVLSNGTVLYRTVNDTGLFAASNPRQIDIAMPNSQIPSAGVLTATITIL